MKPDTYIVCTANRADAVKATSYEDSIKQFLEEVWKDGGDIGILVSSRLETESAENEKYMCPIHVLYKSGLVNKFEVQDWYRAIGAEIPDEYI